MVAPSNTSFGSATSRQQATAPATPGEGHPPRMGPKWANSAKTDPKPPHMPCQPRLGASEVGPKHFLVDRTCMGPLSGNKNPAMGLKFRILDCVPVRLPLWDAAPSRVALAAGRSFGKEKSPHSRTTFRSLTPLHLSTPVIGLFPSILLHFGKLWATLKTRQGCTASKTKKMLILH